MYQRQTTLHVLSLAGLSLLLAGCGGGSTDSANDGELFGLSSTPVTTRVVLQVEEQQQPQRVRLEGCVV